MPIGGETIGTAYVRILADGDGLDRSVREQFRESEDAIHGEGRRGGQAYTEGFKEEMKKSPTQKALRDSIAKALASQDVSKEFFNSAKWREFRTNLEKRFGEAGRVAGINLEKSVQEGMDFSGLKARMNNITREIARATEQIQRAEGGQWKRLLDDAYRMNKKFDDDVLKLRQDRDREFDLSIAHQREAWASLLSDAYRMNRDFDIRLRNQRADQDAEFEHSIRVRASLIDSLSDRYDEIVSHIDKMDRGELHLRGVRQKTIDDLRNLTDDYKRVGIASDDWLESTRNLERRLAFMHPTLNRHQAAIGKIADRMGAAFGRGSRNDFINFIGSMVRGFVNIGQIFPGLIRKVSDFAQTIKFAFDENLRDTGSTFRATMAGVAAALESAGAGVAVFAAAAAGAIIFIGPLVALVSLLAGILTALASTIVFGAVGAIAALAGALGPAIIGFGVLAAAIAGTDWKKLSGDLAKVRTEFSTLAHVASRNLFDDLPVKRFADVIRSLTPLVAKTARAIRDVGSGWIDAADSPAFRRFIRNISVFVPDTLRSLGRIAGNVFAGLGGVFVALEPITRRFLNWLEGITRNFAEWSNSKKGREDIEDFLKRAGDSASSLGNFLGGVSDLLFTLLNAGQGTGDTIFDQMGNALRGFSEDLQKNPDMLKNWFRDAKQLSDQLGTLIIEIGKVFDAFDDENTRAGAMVLIIALAASFATLGGAARIAAAGVRISFHAIGQMIGFLEDTWDRARKLFHGGSLFPGRGVLIAPFVGIAARIGGLISPIVGRAARIFGDVAGNARTGAARVRDAFSGLGSRLGSLIAPVVGRAQSIMASVASAARAGASNLANAFRGIPGRIGSFLTGIPGAVRSALSGAADAARNAASDIVDAFRGLAGRIIAAVGHITLPTPTIHMPSIPKLHIPGLTASGGLFNGAQMRIIGEAGPEAVVPLRRPLAQVDPAVRALSAIAQGLSVPQMADGGVSTRPTIDASGWQIVTAGTDARAVSIGVVNELAARGY